jgi:acyl-CoA thioester hydrolase
MNTFQRDFEVPAEAIDLLGHVGNIEYLRWQQDIALEHSDHVGLTWEQCQQQGGAFVVRRHSLDYLRPAKLGEKLRLTTWVQQSTPMSAVRRTELRDGAGELLFKGETIWVYVSLETQRPRRIPQEVKDRFAMGDSDEMRA